MDDFRYDLILKYFYDRKENYSLEEIIEEIGFNYEQLNSALQYLISNTYLEVKENLIQISPKGKLKLISDDFMHYTFDINERDKTSKIKKLSIDEIYIPNNFKGA